METVLMLKKLYDACRIPGSVLASLSIQILLIILGTCRKSNSHPFIKFVLWSTYLAADVVASFALGAISMKLTIVKNAGCEMDTTTELTAFWAPFLLLHMGGPDTISAYALEDNELWSRRSLTLVSQAISALNVFFTAFTCSRLSLLCIPMFLAGVIKYGERIHALRTASTGNLRGSLFINEDKVNPSSEVSVFQSESQRKKNAGYIVTEERRIDVPFPLDLSAIIEKSKSKSKSKSSLSDDSKLLITAYCFQGITKRLFFNLPLTTKSKDIFQPVFRNLSSQDAFLIIDMELGFMFDSLFTKLSIFSSVWVIISRLIAFIITCSIFILFFFTTFLGQRNNHRVFDISLTFVLMVGAIVLDIYSALVMLYSDRFLVWLSMHNNNKILQAIKRNPSRKPRWSNNISQLSIVNLLSNPKPLPCSCLLDLLHIDYKKWEMRWYSSQTKVPEDLKQLIFRYFKNREAETSNDDSQQSLKKMNDSFCVEIGMDRELSFADDYGKSILFWHTVTEVSYHLCEAKIKNQVEGIVAHCQLIQVISRYMLSLLLLRPSLLSIYGIEPTSFKRTTDAYRVRLGRLNEIKACNNLVAPHENNPTNGRLDKLLEQATACAAQIRNDYYETGSLEKWNLLGGVWLKFMEQAVRNSQGSEHAKLLIDGGEFFSHAWLLMIHFGLTDHFQITEMSEETGYVAV